MSAGKLLKIKKPFSVYCKECQEEAFEKAESQGRISWQDNDYKQKRFATEKEARQFRHEHIKRKASSKVQHIHLSIYKTTGEYTAVLIDQGERNKLKL